MEDGIHRIGGSHETVILEELRGIGHDIAAECQIAQFETRLTWPSRELHKPASCLSANVPTILIDHGGITAEELREAVQVPSPGESWGA